MNNFRICLHNHFIFKGFTVQPGMVFGLDNEGHAIISNGKLFKDGYWIYINYGLLDGIFTHVLITQESHPQIYNKIQKALRQRERKNINGVEYRTSAQLEAERWKADLKQSFFKEACTPIGNTPKVKTSVNEKGIAKYNSMRERNTLTQKLTVCKYNTANGHIIII